MNLFLREDYRHRKYLRPWCWITVFLLVVSGMIFGIHAWNRVLDKESCYNWGRATERPVRFEYLTSWSYACYTPGYTGKWVLNTSTDLFAPTNNRYNVNLNTGK